MATGGEKHNGGISTQSRGAHSPIMLSACVPVPLSRCRCPGSVPVPLSRCCSRLVLCRSYEEAARPRRQARGLTRARGAAAPSRRPQRGVAAVAPLADHRSCCGWHPGPPTPARSRPAPVSTWSRSTTEFPPPTRSGFWCQVCHVSGMSIFRSFSDRFQIIFRSVSDVLR